MDNHTNWDNFYWARLSDRLLDDVADHWRRRSEWLIRRREEARETTSREE